MKKNRTVCRIGIRKSENRIMLAFFLNLLFAFVEVWGGALTGSVTIFSDAIHDFGDCVALGIAWRMEKISKKKPNEKYHFGYRRFSVIAGLINNLILLAGGVVIIVTSVQRFFCPKEIDGGGMLLFAIAGILMNGAAMLLTARGKNINEKTISIHMLEDVLTWVAVFLVGIVMCFYDLPVLDSLLSIGMTIVIFIGVAKNMKRIFAVLTARCPLSTGQYLQLRKALEGCAEAVLLQELRLFSMDGEDKQAEVRLQVLADHSVEEQAFLVRRVRDVCVNYGISHVIVELYYEQQ